MAILKVEGLTIEFQMEGGIQPTVTDVSFSLEKGEILALVGESGCGKSVSCMAMARLLPEPPARIAAGKVMLQKRDGAVVDVLKLSGRELRKIRGGEIAYIFQEPSVSLNPVFRVGEQIAEAVSLHRPDVADPWAEAVKLCAGSGYRSPATGFRGTRMSFPAECSRES
ncbi:MAG: ATP-binding cassette domain-containing protein [Victivallales bacterium]